MSSKQDVSKPHKCIFSKCKGTLCESAEKYGYWAYWHPASTGAAGWYSAP